MSAYESFEIKGLAYKNGVKTGLANANIILYEEIKEKASVISATSDKSIYSLNENIVITIVTNNLAANLRILINGNTAAIKSSSFVQNGDTKTWTVILAISTKGEKIINIAALDSNNVLSDNSIDIPLTLNK